ncbi:MAG: hypothetical protein J0M26_21205 [Planctomycetes bacterium]|nr:hypothetical protein [Planctomycetota bacterium]
MLSTAPARRLHRTFLVFVSFATAIAPVELKAQQEGTSKNHRALWGKATLVVDSSSLPIRRVRDIWPFEKRVGTYLIRLKENVLEVVDFASLNLIWKETNSNGNTYRLIGADERTLYLVEEPRSQSSKAAADVSVMRRELSTGKKLETIPISADSSDERHSSRIIGAITKPNCVYLLTMLFSETDDFTPKPISYRLTKFSDTVDWSKRFDSAGALESPGAFLLGTFGPALDGSSSQTLVEMDSQIIVNAGPLEDIMAINSQSGQIEWTIPRLWEYRRGFIGPSVWSYYLGRYGMEDHDIETATKTLEQIKEQNKQEFTIDEEYFSALKQQVNVAREKIESEPGWILAGPVAIKTGKEDDDKRLFVVTAQSDGNSPWSNYLANAVVYELSDDGKLISMVTLPRLLQRNKFVVLSDRIVWNCEDGAILELFPTPDAFSSDTFTKINWKSASEVPERKAWLRQGSFYLTHDYYGSNMFSLVEGGYLEQSDSQEIKFPILLTNLVSGEKKGLLLRLPFQGRAYTPTNNYSHGPNGWVSLSDYLFTIVSIQVDGATFSVTIENEEAEPTVLEFDISALIETLNKG